MNRAVRLSMIVAIIATFAFAAVPASAATTCVIDPLSSGLWVYGNSEYGGGIYYPGFGAPDGAGPNVETVAGRSAIEPSATQDAFNWDVILPCANGGAAVASGTATGWCGHSIGTSTSGTYTDADGNNSTITIDWISAGSQLLLTPTGPDGAVGVVIATPPFYWLLFEPCAWADGATYFMLTGAVVVDL